MPIFLWMILSEEERFAVEALFQAYEPGLHRLAYALLRDHHLAEEVVQDAFLSLIRDEEHLNGRSMNELRNYLFAKARYLIRDAAEARRNEFPAEEDWITRLREEETTDRDLLREIGEVRISEELDAIIDGMSETTQEILYLKYGALFTNGEIAERLGITYGAVSARLSRAYGELRKELRREEQPND